MGPKGMGFEPFWSEIVPLPSDVSSWNHAWEQGPRSVSENGVESLQEAGKD